MAGIASSTTEDAKPISPPPEPPAAEGHGGGDSHNSTTNTNNDTALPLLEDPLERVPDLFQQMAIPSSSAGASAAPLSPPPEPPAADVHLAGGADHDHDNDDNVIFSSLVDLLERFPDLFAQKVLQHLDPIDRTFLAQAGSTCRAVVAASDLPSAGMRRVQLECVCGETQDLGVLHVRRSAGVGQG